MKRRTLACVGVIAVFAAMYTTIAVADHDRDIDIKVLMELEPNGDGRKAPASKMTTIDWGEHARDCDPFDPAPGCKGRGVASEHTGAMTGNDYEELYPYSLFITSVKLTDRFPGVPAGQLKYGYLLSAWRNADPNDRACVFLQMPKSKLWLKSNRQSRLDADIYDESDKKGATKCKAVTNLPFDRASVGEQAELTIRVYQLTPQAHDEWCKQHDCAPKFASDKSGESNHEHEEFPHSKHWNFKPMTNYDYAVYKHCGSGGAVAHCGRW